MLAEPDRERAAKNAWGLAGDRIELWLFDMTDPAFLQGAEAGPTSVAEQTRAAALRSPLAGRQLLARRAAMRGILGSYLNIEPPAVRLLVAPGGKPMLAHGPAFSAAHSEGLFAVAVSGSSSIGLDVEHRRPVAGGQAIAERWFSAEEARILSSLKDSTTSTGTANPAAVDPNSEAFLRLWCAKEALAKRHGAGIRLMTSGSGEVGGPLHVHAALASAHLQYVDAGPSHLVAVASTAPISSVAMRQAVSTR